MSDDTEEDTDPWEALKKLPEAAPHSQPAQVWPSERTLPVHFVWYQSFGGWGQPFQAFSGAYVYSKDASYGEFGEASWDGDDGKRVSGSFYEFLHSDQLHRVCLPNKTMEDAREGILAVIGGFPE